MAVDTASDILAFKKQGTGNNLNTWGDELNNALDRISEAIADRTEKSLTGNYTLTSTNYIQNESRSAALVFSDGGLSATPTVTLPARKKLYWAKNTGSTYGVTLGVSGGTSVTIPTGGRWVFVLCDGTDCEIHDPSVSDLKAPTAALSMNSQKITSLADPTNAQDAATKNYIDTLASSGDLATVAGIASDITTVAGNNANITTVAGNNANVTTVAGISGNVTTVAGIASNVTTVAGISANVTTVADDSADIQALAAITANINTVAGISANVTTVATNETTINTVATNITDVVTVSTNITDVQNAASLLTYASKVQAEAGTAEDVQMNPLRTKQAIDALAGGGWTEITSTPVAGTPTTIDFTGIPSTYNELLIFADGVSHNHGSLQTWNFQVSNDNGTTWSSSRSSGGTYSGATPADVIFHVFHAQDDNPYFLTGNWVSSSLGSSPSTYPMGNFNGIATANTGGIDAFRIHPSGGNFDAGTVTIWGKK